MITFQLKPIVKVSARHFRLALTVATFSLAGTAFAADFSTSSLQQYIQTQKTVAKAAPNSPEAKMGAALLGSVNSGSSKSIGSKIPVLVKAQPRSGSRVASQMRAKGMNVQDRIGDDIYAYVFSTQLDDIASISAVQSFNLQPTVSIGDDAIDNLMSQIGLGGSSPPSHRNDASRLPTSTASNDVVPNANDAGNLSIHANELHNRGYYGEGVKIGIIDFGYNGYDTLLNNGILPNPVNQATFFNNSQSSRLNTTSGSEHGTACTEIIYNLAPKADYYLAQIGDGVSGVGGGDLLEAIDWMISQDVDVINFSGGGHGQQHNGQASLDRKVEQVVDKGILWINAAGNEGNDHWGGIIADRDRNGLVDLNGNNYLEVYSYGVPFLVTFNWDDWGDTSPFENIDLDAYLVDTQGQMVAKQEVVRNPNTSAVDFMIADVPEGKYAIALSTNKTSSKKVHVIVRNAMLIDVQPQGSIGIPATSKASLSVGAWDVVSKQMADYSSRGKTDDNRIKPEISAPTNVLSKSYQLVKGSDRFPGTSASAPYATGFAALVWSANPSWSAQKMKQYLQSQAVRSIQSPVPNVNSGYGLLDARRVLGLPDSQNYAYPSDSNRPRTTAPSHSTQNDDEVQDLLNSIGL